MGKEVRRKKTNKEKVEELNDRGEREDDDEEMTHILQ